MLFRGRFCLALGIVALCFPLSAMEWPNKEAKQSLNFGMTDDGSPVLGMTFVGTGNVFSADSGEIIFSTDEDDFSRSIPAPLGTWVAVDHGEGLVGIYGRGSETGLSREIKRAGIDTALTVAGKSGWARDTGFYFTIYDRKERRWVNPVVILGKLPDTIYPSIQRVMLRSDTGQLLDLNRTGAVRQGRYSIVVDAIDWAESATRALAPYRIGCSLNGAEVGVLALEIFSVRDGKLMIYGNGLVPASDVYSAAPAVVAASDQWFSRGQARLEIIVQDFNRNTRRAFYRVYVE